MKSIEGVEGEFARGDFRFLRTYLLDALGWHLTNLHELQRRKTVLCKHLDGHDDVPIYVAVLAVLTNDRPLWGEIAAKFGDDLPPSTGYFAFGCLNNASISADIKAEWHHLIGFSAAKGHPASLDLVKQNNSVFGRIKAIFGTHTSFD